MIQYDRMTLGRQAKELGFVRDSFLFERKKQGTGIVNYAEPLANKHYVNQNRMPIYRTL